MKISLQILLIALSAIFFANSTLAAPLDIAIIAPEYDRSITIGQPSSEGLPAVWYDLAQMESHLEGLLTGSLNHQNSTVTVLNSARSLLNLNRDFYENHTEDVVGSAITANGINDYNDLENNDYDVAILINDADLLAQAPSSAFEGTLHMANKLLRKGIDVYLFEPDSNSFIGLVGENELMKESANAIINRIANGCGIHVVPAGTALGNLSAQRDHIDYILSSSIFTTITGEGNQTDNEYNPSGIDSTTRATIETAIANAITSEKQATNYTGTFNGKGIVIHRPIELNNDIKFAWLGTSTETQVKTSLERLINEHYLLNGETSISASPHETENYGDDWFVADPELLDDSKQYLFSYYRTHLNDQSSLYEPEGTAPQPDLLHFAFTRQYAFWGGEGSVGYVQGALSHIANASGSWNEMSNIRSAHTDNGYVIPSLSIVGRIFDQYPDSSYAYDEHHQMAEHGDAVAAGFLASAVGIDFDDDELDRSKFYHENSLYYMGWNLIMQQAYLSEDRAYIPDSDLAVSTTILPNATSSSPLALSLTATGGTAPYTWEETTGTLPVGISLHKDGTLTGSPTYGGEQTNNLIFKVTDANGAIRKKALQLESTGANADAAYYGWDTGYYFDTTSSANFISGTVITALNGGSSNITVDGITFSAHDLGGGNKAAYTGGITPTGDTNYDALLSSMSEGGANEEFITLSGLTTGESYTLQIFYNNKSDPDGYASQMLANIDGIGDIALKGSNNGTDSADYGSYGVARFIASNSSVQLSLKARSDQHSIKGTAAFNALLLTQQPANSLHTGTTRHTEITWTTPVEATGLQDLIEGTPVKALNGGVSDIPINAFGITFEATSIGTEADEPNDNTLSYGSSSFASLISEQTRTTRHASITFDNLTIGQEYQLQVFNKSKPISEYHHTENYKGSDTFFGLSNQEMAYIFEDGKVMQSVGTFTAESSSQVIELKSNGNNLIQDVSFSAMYLVESIDSVTVLDDGTNQAPSLVEVNGADTTFVNFASGMGNIITSFVGSDPDTGDTLRYSIVSGNDNSSFRMNSITGELSLVDTLSGSITGTYILEVMVSDNKVPAKTAMIQHTIKPLITDDSDGDGFTDTIEIYQGTNPFDASIKPFLLGYWDFDDPSNPLLVNGHLGSPDGAVLSGAGYTDDQGGFSSQPGDHAMDFGVTTASQRVVITDLTNVNAATANNIISFSFWQKNYEVSLNSILTGTSPTSNGGNNFYILSPHQTIDDLAWKFENNTKTTWVQYDDSSFTLDWTHYVYIKNQDRVEIWVNGEQMVAVDHDVAVAPDLTELTIGARQNGGWSLRGKIDDFAIYNGALSQDQITHLAQGGSPLNLIDTDDDGIMDAWELSHFGDLNTADDNTDTDGDGQNDRSEFIGGTTPTETSSLLAIDHIAVQGDSGNLSWKGKRNRVYKLLYSEDLSGWTPLDGEYTVNEDDEEIMLDLNAENIDLPEKGFYRVQVEL